MNLHLDIRIVFKKLLSSNHELEDSRPSSPLKSLKSQIHSSIHHLFSLKLFKSLLRGEWEEGGEKGGEEHRVVDVWERKGFKICGSTKFVCNRQMNDGNICCVGKAQKVISYVFFITNS